MALLFWDASGLAKRYVAESGSQTVNAVFAQAQSHILASTPWGYAETYFILLRKLSGGVLSRTAWAQAVNALQTAVVNSPVFGLFPLDEEIVFASVTLMQRHNLNATDAAILTLLLEYANSPDALTCLLIASDQRLLRAANTEGLATLNPEQVSPLEVPAILAALSSLG